MCLFHRGLKDSGILVGAYVFVCVFGSERLLEAICLFGVVNIQEIIHLQP